MKPFSIVFAFLLFVPACSAQSQSGPQGPDQGGMEDNFILGQFVDWDRKATPTLVLRIHGAGRLQTFADISDSGEFKLTLPEVPAKGNYGSVNCRSLTKGLIVVATDISLLTQLPGFSSPGRWDQGYSQIGMALFADETFSMNIGKASGKRAHWMFSLKERSVEVDECNNANSFQLDADWNAFTVVSGPSGGPHIYHTGLDDELGWYWYAFPEDMAKGVPLSSSQAQDSVESTQKTRPDASEIKAEWLLGEWTGVQADVQMQMQLKPSGGVWLESEKNGRMKTMKGNWSLSDGEFVLDIEEGELRFNIEKSSETSFRLFGKAASSEIVFTRGD